MVITLYHRSQNVVTDGPCDLASVKVETVDGQLAGFIGAAWGEHTPVDVLRFHHCEPDDVDEVLAGWGLQRSQEPPLGGQG